MNSADVWHPTDNPEGDMTSILEESVEQAKQRHPSGRDLGNVASTMTAADRCDGGCGAGALYRLRQTKGNRVLDLCHHHSHKYANAMDAEGWKLADHNPTLLRELYATDRLKGSDHA